MAGPTPIQIQRTMNFGTPNTTQTAANGQLVYSGNSQALFINFGGTIYAIGGLRVPGTLTANQALVANSTSGIDKVITANVQTVDIGVTGIMRANGAVGTLNQVLTTNSTGGVFWSSPGAASVNTQASYTWTNTHTFQANVSVTGNSTAEILVGVPFQAAALGGSVANQTGFYVGNSTVNSSWTYSSLVLGTTTVGNASITEGTLGAAAAVGGVQINTTSIALGNSTVNGTIGYNSVSVGALASNATTVGVGANVYMDATRHFAGNATVNAVLTSASLQFNGGNTVNNTIYTGQATSVANAGISVGPTTPLVSNATGLWVLANSGIVANSTGLWANVGSGIVLTGGAITVNSVLSLTNLTLSGNLTVQGTTTTLDTTNLLVKDNQIVLADQLASTGTFLDNVDTGFHVKTGNTSVNFYSGLARVAASSTNTNPVFKLFSTATNPNNTIIDTTANTGTLIAWLNSGALTSNATNVAITATGSFGVNIVANTLSLSTALPGTSGGTGKGTVANNSLLYGNSTNGYNELVLGTTGYVLQSNGTAIVYDVIDGGTF